MRGYEKAQAFIGARIRGQKMKVLVIPTTDWIRHPVPNRLNFIFDILAGGMRSMCCTLI